MLNHLQRSAVAFALVIAVAVLVWVSAQDALASSHPAYVPCGSVELSTTEPNVESIIMAE